MVDYATLSSTLSTGLFHIMKRSFFRMSGKKFNRVLIMIKGDDNNGNVHSESSSSCGGDDDDNDFDEEDGEDEVKYGYTNEMMPYQT